MNKKKLKKKLMNTEVKLTPKDMQKLRESVLEESISVINLIPLMVLRDKFGFGVVRLERYLDHLYDAIDSFNKGYINLIDVAEMLESEVGLKIERGGQDEEKEANQ